MYCVKKPIFDGVICVLLRIKHCECFVASLHEINWVFDLVNLSVIMSEYFVCKKRGFSSRLELLYVQLLSEIVSKHGK
jgi:hypothetical protein